MKVEESLNVTFDESPPPTKLSPLVDDDVGEEEDIERKVKMDNNNVENESIEVDEVVNIKESRPLEQVIGNPNQRTLRSQAQNKSNFFCCISTIEPWNVNEALGDESWVVAMQEELNQFIANDIKQMEDGIFFNQSKYIKEMLKKFGLEDSKPTKTPMSTKIKLTKDDEADSVDSTKYRDQFSEMTSLPNQGICVYTDSWSLDALKNNLEPNPPYHSNFPPLDDIRAMTHQRVIFEKETKEGIMHKLLNQIKTNELLDHLKPCELVIRENAYVAIGNRDHVQASIALMLYCLEVGRPFNLAYFVIRRMDYFRERVASSNDEDLPSTKFSPRTYNRAFPARENMSNEQRETKGMFKNMARALHSMGRMLKKECH
ncbi:hypothetical protein Tco_1309984 [Tanacetum coccineum]